MCATFTEVGHVAVGAAGGGGKFADGGDTDAGFDWGVCGCAGTTTRISKWRKRGGGRGGVGGRRGGGRGGRGSSSGAGALQEAGLDDRT